MNVRAQAILLGGSKSPSRHCYVHEGGVRVAQTLVMGLSSLEIARARVVAGSILAFKGQQEIGQMTQARG